MDRYMRNIERSMTYHKGFAMWYDGAKWKAVRGATSIEADTFALLLEVIDLTVAERMAPACGEYCASDCAMCNGDD